MGAISKILASAKASSEMPVGVLSIIRILVGSLLLFSGVRLLLGEGGAEPVVTNILTNAANSTRTFGFYSAFAQSTLESGIGGFAIFYHSLLLIAGFGLTFGFATRISAIAMIIWVLIRALQFGPFVFGASSNGLFLGLAIIFFLTRAGQKWGLDGWLSARGYSPGWIG